MAPPRNNNKKKQARSQAGRSPYSPLAGLEMSLPTLALLSGATSLHTFQLLDDRMEYLEADLATLAQGSHRLIPDDLHQQLIELLCTAARAALAQLQQHCWRGAAGCLVLPECTLTLNCIVSVVYGLSNSLNLRYAFAANSLDEVPDEATLQEFRQQAVAAFQSSGVLQPLAALMSSTAATLQHHQQAAQQLQQVNQHAAAPCSSYQHMLAAWLAKSLLSLWQAMAMLERLVYSGPLAVTLPAVVQLAAAVFDGWPVCQSIVRCSSSRCGCSTGSSSNSSSSSNRFAAGTDCGHHCLRGKLMQTAQMAVAVADDLCRCFMHELMTDGLVHTDPRTRLVSTGVLISDAMQRLLLINMACKVQLLHQQQKGLSAATVLVAGAGQHSSLEQQQGQQKGKQQQQVQAQQLVVPAYHTSLFEALGLAGMEGEEEVVAGILVSEGQAAATGAMDAAVVALRMSLRQRRDLLPSSSSSSSERSSTTSPSVAASSTAPGGNTSSGSRHVGEQGVSSMAGSAADAAAGAAAAAAGGLQCSQPLLADQLLGPALLVLAELQALGFERERVRQAMFLDTCLNAMQYLLGFNRTSAGPSDLSSGLTAAEASTARAAPAHTALATAEPATTAATAAAASALSPAAAAASEAMLPAAAECVVGDDMLGTILQSMLLLAGPALLHALEPLWQTAGPAAIGTGSSAAAGAEGRAVQSFDTSLMRFGGLLVSLAHTHTDDVGCFTAALQQQPLSSLQVLEAVLRSQAAADDASEMACLPSQLASYIIAVSQAVAPAAAVLADVQQQQQQRITPLLFSLLLSCTKLVEQVIPDSVQLNAAGSNDTVWDNTTTALAPAAAELVMMAATAQWFGGGGENSLLQALRARHAGVGVGVAAGNGAAAMIGSSSGSDNASSSSRSGRPADAGTADGQIWLVLAARSLRVFGQGLLLVAAALERCAPPEGGHGMKAVEEWHAVFCSVLGCVRWLGAELLQQQQQQRGKGGPAAATAADGSGGEEYASVVGLQQLSRLQQDVERQLQAVIAGVAQLLSVVVVDADQDVSSGTSEQQHGSSSSSGVKCDVAATSGALSQPEAAWDQAVAVLVSQLGVLGPLLEQFGAAIATQLPLRHCCNNPGCGQLAQLSELQLVGGKACICGGCRTARYCGKECQLAHWKAHKPVCRRIKAVGAIGAVAG